MSSHSQLMQQYETLLEQQAKLHETCLSLKDVQKLLDMQEEQQELIEELQQESNKLEGQPLDPQTALFIEEKQASFQKLNKDFMDVLSVKKGLIQKELKELKSSQSQLKKMKQSYVKQNANLGKSKRFNTLS